MADIPQLISNSDALVGVALGAGLTYGFGSLNRRRQEARENETRWYEERLRAYVAFYQAVYEALFRMGRILGRRYAPPMMRLRASFIDFSMTSEASNL
jgi:hypothetical protein